VLALRYRDGRHHGRRPPGDRRVPGREPTHREDLKADDLSGVGIAGAAGPAMEMAKLFQTELEHYEKVEGDNLSLDGKANKLGQMIRMNLQAAMMGLAVVPIFAGFDEKAGVAASSSTTSRAAATRRRTTTPRAPVQGRARLAEELWKRDMGRDDAAAGDARGAHRRRRRGRRHRRPRPRARHFPEREDITRSGFGDVGDDEVKRVCESILADRARIENGG